MRQHDDFGVKDVEINQVKTNEGEISLSDEKSEGFDQSFDRKRSKPEVGAIKNIFFVGLTGAGKTSVGWGLAKEIGMGFIDLDEWIEESYEKSISDLVEDEGEQAFRLMEHQAVKQVMDVRNHVISLGGGTVMNDKNWQMIKESGVSVWIQGNPMQVAKRLSNDLEALDQRPLLSRFAKISDDAERLNKVKAEVENMLAARAPRYSECDFQIDLSHAAVDSSVKQVKELLRSGGVLSSGSFSKKFVSEDL